MSTTPNDLARCDGLLPKLTRMPNGAEGILWSVDCKQRETCARFVDFQRDVETGFNGDPDAHRTYLAASHGPDEACPTFVQHTEGGE